MDKKSRELVMGKLYLKNKDYKMAEKSFLEYLNSSPEDFQALKMLAQVYEHLNDISKAFDLYERCYLAQPDRKGVLLDICRLLLMNDSHLDHVDPRKWLKLAIQAFPSNPIVTNLRDTLPINDHEPAPSKTTVGNELVLDKLDSLEQRLMAIERILTNLTLAPQQKPQNSVEHVKVEPAKIEPVKAEPIKVEPVKVEPAKVEPIKIEPAKSPVRIEAAKSPVKVEPEKKTVTFADPTPPPKVSEPSPIAHSVPEPKTSGFPFMSFGTDQKPGNFSFAPFAAEQKSTNFGLPQATANDSTSSPKLPVFKLDTKPVATPPAPSPSPFKTPEVKSDSKVNVSLFGPSPHMPKFEPKILDFSNWSMTKPDTPAFSTSSDSGNLFADSLKKFNLPAEGSWTTPKKEEDVKKEGEEKKDEGGDEGDNEVVESPELPIENFCDMQPIEIRSGEEDEDIVFEYRCKLFRFRDKEYKERGLGNIKVLKHRSTGAGRLIMRRELINLVCLNCWSCSKIERVRDTQVRFAGLDASDGEPEMTVFLAKFKTQELTDKFMGLITELFPDE